MNEKYPDSLRSVNIEQICKNQNFGELHFESVITLLKLMIGEIVEIEDLDYRNNLTQFEIVQIDNARSSIRSYVSQIENFSITQPDAAQLRDSVINGITSYYENSFATQTRQPLLYLREKARIGVKDSESEYKKLAAELSGLVTDAKKDKERLQNDRDAIKSGHAMVTSEYLSKFFNKESEDACKLSGSLKKKFNIQVIILIVVLIVIFIIYILTHNVLTSKDAKIEFSVISATLVAVMFFYLKVTLREYNITRHIQISNKHRANVASTVESLLSQVERDAELKSSLIKEASVAIFQADSTGYLTKDQIEVNAPIKEVINTVMKR